MSLTVYGLIDTIAGVLTGIGVFCDGCLQFTHLIYSNSCHRYYVIYILLVFPLASVNFSALGMAIERFQVVRNSVSQSSKFHRFFPFAWTMTTCLSAFTFMIVLWGNTQVDSVQTVQDFSFRWEKGQEIRHTRHLLDDLWAYNSQYDSSADQQEEIIVNMVRSIVQNFSSPAQDSELNDRFHDFNLSPITQHNSNLSPTLEHTVNVSPGYHNILSKFPVRRFNTTVSPLNYNKAILAKVTDTPSSPNLPSRSDMTKVTGCNATQREATHVSQPDPNLAKTFLPSIADIINLLTGPHQNGQSPQDIKDQGTTNGNLNQDHITEQNHETSPTPTITTQSFTESHTKTEEPITETVNSEIPLITTLEHSGKNTMTNAEPETTTSLHDTVDSSYGVTTLDSTLIITTKMDSVIQEYNDTSATVPELTTSPTDHESIEVEIEANVASSDNATSDEQVSEEIEVKIFTTETTEGEEASTPSLCPTNALIEKPTSDTPITITTSTPLTEHRTTNFKTSSQMPDTENIANNIESDVLPGLIPSQQENVFNDSLKPTGPPLYIICYTKERFLQSYTTIIFTCIFALPLLVTTGLNLYMAWSLSHYRHSRLTETTNNNWLRLRKAVLQALILLAANAICWVPFLVERLLYAWVPDWDFPSAVPALLFLLGHSHTVLRGLFYLWQNTKVQSRVSPEPIRPASLPGMEGSPVVPMQVTTMLRSEGDHPFLVPHAMESDIPSPRTAKLVPREPIARSLNPSPKSTKLQTHTQ
ncbi:uncharacterized protein LOC125024593 isoform X1 [Penaeus chinensis]|uniref:uncharacterized protein LOC125024593 isoform X1 n=2 Tax=Penaeus chinensis TaxID=139456 RepID=UPI001FB84CD7|nr:uncharacterized protein LOC125024593 isoform X1 [Penaeus chinensis]